MITIEKVEEAWENFGKFKETAEQHEIPTLLFIDLKFAPLYEDLHKNWNEHHAEIFMKWMLVLSERFGFKCPEFRKDN